MRPMSLIASSKRQSNQSEESAITVINILHSPPFFFLFIRWHVGQILDHYGFFVFREKLFKPLITTEWEITKLTLQYDNAFRLLVFPVKSNSAECFKYSTTYISTPYPWKRAFVLAQFQYLLRLKSSLSEGSFSFPHNIAQHSLQFCIRTLSDFIVRISTANCELEQKVPASGLINSITLKGQLFLLYLKTYLGHPVLLFWFFIELRSAGLPGLPAGQREHVHYRETFSGGDFLKKIYCSLFCFGNGTIKKTKLCNSIKIL